MSSVTMPIAERLAVTPARVANRSATRRARASRAWSAAASAAPAEASESLHPRGSVARMKIQTDHGGSHANAHHEPRYRIAHRVLRRCRHECEPHADERRRDGGTEPNDRGQGRQRTHAWPDP